MKGEILKMDLKSVLNYVTEIISAVDQWDDTVIADLDFVCQFSFVPAEFKIAVSVAKQYEPEILTYGKQVIAFIGGILNADGTVTQTPNQKLAIATAKAVENIPVEKTPELIKTIEGKVNSLYNIAHDLIKKI